MSDLSPGSMEFLIQQVRNQCQSLLRIASAQFGEELSCPEIRVDLRGQAAGQMRYRKLARNVLRGSQQAEAIGEVCLRFNPKLLQRYQDEFIAQTVPHEVAHYVAYTVFGMGIRPHGKEWKYVMQEVFGVEPKTRHSFEVEKQNRPTFPYRCACVGVEHQLGQIRHRRVSQGKAKYLCRKCESTLVPEIET